MKKKAKKNTGILVRQMRYFVKKFERVESISDVFELVKEIVKEFLDLERGGLMLGLMELGAGRGYFVGAFHQVGSNLIVMNKTPLRVIEETRPEMSNAYCFHILLHEYLHSLGLLDEDYTRLTTIAISERAFGEDHPITLISKNFSSMFPEITHMDLGWRPPEMKIDFVSDFDRSNTTYIG
jgi:hypothetical protein